MTNIKIFVQIWSTSCSSFLSRAHECLSVDQEVIPFYTTHEPSTSAFITSLLAATEYPTNRNLRKNSCWLTIWSDTIYIDKLYSYP